MSRLTSVVSCQRKHKDAEQAELQMVASMKNVVGTESPATIKFLGFLAVRLHARGQREESEQIQPQNLLLLETILGP